LEKTIRRKGRRNLSKLQKKIYIKKKKRAWIFESQNPTLGGIKKKKRERGKKE
jgi:hypothetical protein